MNAPAASTSNTATLREIEGLRAVAVLSVLLYHGGFGFSGGYVGVDVFFVVSGFLITTLLLRERDSTGRISLSGFYARRARRLLPAATLVLLATVVLTYQLLSPVRAHQTAVDAMWAGGFVANLHFANIGANYLQSTLPPSVLQHWWSLAVEEQFYLLWPGLLALVWRLTRHLRVSGLAVCAVLGGASFVMGAQLTDTDPAWGYFGTWSRGWELLVGAACAFGWQHRDRLPLRHAAGWLGLALVGWATFRLDATTAFPGAAALLPVAGTVLIIASIGRAGSPGRVLSVGPLQWVGGRSYAIYLWHWPLLMILHDRVEHPSAAARAGVLAGSVVLAALSYVLLENPVRHWPTLVRSRTRSLAMGALLVALVMGAAGVTANATDDIHFDTGYVAPTVPRTTVPGTDATSDTGTGTVPPSPRERLDAMVAKELQPLIAASTDNDLLPENITPPISEQAHDSTIVFRNGCMVPYHGLGGQACEYGDTTSSVGITLFGDSHVDQWFPGLEAAALSNHWKLKVETKMGCAAASVKVMHSKRATYPECDRWQPEALARIAASDTDLVIITQWRANYYRNIGGEFRSMPDDAWRTALTTTITTLTAAGKQVLLLSDAPIPGQMMNDCLATYPRDIGTCSLDAGKHVNTHENDLERDLAQELHVLFHDTTAWFCADGQCPAVIGNVAVYLDTNHVNNTYGLFLAPYLELLVRDALQLG